MLAVKKSTEKLFAFLGIGGNDSTDDKEKKDADQWSRAKGIGKDLFGLGAITDSIPSIKGMKKAD